MRVLLLTILATGALAVQGASAAFPDTAPLAVSGPDTSMFTLSLSHRLRGEFADWFDAGGAAANSDYGYLGNRTQVGLLATWRGLSGFLQYQHTILDDVPQQAAGVGGTYRANTKSDFQEGGWLRQEVSSAALGGAPFLHRARLFPLPILTAVVRPPSLSSARTRYPSQTVWRSARHSVLSGTRATGRSIPIR